MFASTRRVHRLRKGKRLSAQTEFIFVDTETTNEDGKVDVGRHTLDFGVAIYVRYGSGRTSEIIRKEFLKFSTASEFFDWACAMVRNSRSVWMVAHNWNFDAGILSLHTQLESRGYELKKYINGKPPVIIDYRDEFGRTIKIVDSLNYFVSSLESLGQSVGIPKLEMPSVNDREAFERYAWRDVEIVQAVIDKFRTFVIEHRLGIMKETLASQAYSAFKRRFMKHDIFVHDREQILKLERASYHGGRTESFYKGSVEDTLYKLDINSHYPAEMLTRNYPTRIVEVLKGDIYKEDLVDRLNLGYNVLVSCNINTTFDAFAYKGDKLIFPIGYFGTALTTAEVGFALKYDTIKSISQIVSYKSDPIFKEYVEYFYQRRMEFKEQEDDAFSYMAKILLNSLYGKFGQRGRRWETHQGDGIGFWKDVDSSNVQQIRIVGGLKQVLSTKEEAYESIPIIASEVTAAARITLYRYIMESGFDCYYADTDSLIVGEQGYQRLSKYIGDKIGQLKLEEVSEYSIFVAPKHYYFNGKWTIKGIRKNAKQLGVNRYQQDKFTSWDVHFRRGEEGFIDITSGEKRLSGINNKRQDREVEGWLKPLEVGVGHENLQI